MQEIDKELDSAREALRVGNEGRARVCARRAAGNALAWLRTRYPKPGQGNDALRRLQDLRDDPDAPPEISAAAARLTAPISKQFTYPTSDPLSDALSIIGYVRGKMLA